MMGMLGIRLVPTFRTEGAVGLRAAYTDTREASCASGWSSVVGVPSDEVYFSGPSALVVWCTEDTCVREEAWVIPVRAWVA